MKCTLCEAGYAINSDEECDRKYFAGINRKVSFFDNISLFVIATALDAVAVILPGARPFCHSVIV